MVAVKCAENEFGEKLRWASTVHALGKYSGARRAAERAERTGAMWGNDRCVRRLRLGQLRARTQNGRGLLLACLCVAKKSSRTFCFAVA